MAPCVNEEPAFPVVLIGYGAVLLLLTLYWYEAGRWHKSRKYESLYMILVLLLVPLTNVVAAARKRDLCFYQTSSWELADHLFRQALQLVLIFEMQRFMWPQVHPLFFESRPLCSHTLKDAPAQVGGIARDIEQTLAEVLAHSPVLLPEGLLAPFIFVFFILEDFLWSMDNSERAAACCGYVTLTVVLVALMHMVHHINTTEPQIEHLIKVINRLVTRGEKETLQLVLARVSVATLLEVGGPAMMALLTDLALEKHMLSLLAKAILVNALQQKGVYFCKNTQKAVLRLVCSCRGEDLTALKNIIDGSGNYNNLYKLVFRDMRDPRFSQQLRDHIAEQGATVRRKIGGSFGIKVLSDVDDTLYSSGGRFPAGCDKRYPKHMVYPGCLSFFRVLDRDRGNWSEDMKRALSVQGAVSCNLVFLSARPHIYKDVAECQSYRLFRSLVWEERLHCVPTLIPGVLGDGLRAMLTHPFLKTAAWRRVGVNKHRTSAEFRSLYPEYDFVFCGDNGQGDLYAAELMLGRSTSSSPRLPSTVMPESEAEAEETESTPAERSSSSSSMVAAFIHEVLPEEQALAHESPDRRGAAWRAELEKRGLFFHRTYVQAALALHGLRPDLVTLQDLEMVADEAIREFEASSFAYNDSKAGWWKAAGDELSVDLLRASATLVAAGRPPLRKLNITVADEKTDEAQLDLRNVDPGQRRSIPLLGGSGFSDTDEETDEAGEATTASECDRSDGLTHEGGTESDTGSADTQAETDDRSSQRNGGRLRTSSGTSRVSFSRAVSQYFVAKDEPPRRRERRRLTLW